MKYIIPVAIALFGIISSSYAQLKVHTNGNTSILNTTQALSPLSINYAGNSQYAVAYKGDFNGIYCENSGNSSTRDYAGNFLVRCKNNKYSFGLHSEVLADTAGITGNGSYAVVGRAGDGAKCFGVLGCVKNCTRGAGVFGSSSLTYGYIPTSHVYAGYFNGDVNITSNLTVSGSIQGSLLGASASSLPSGAVSQRSLVKSGETASLLSALDATEYRYDSDSNNSLETQDGQSARSLGMYSEQTSDEFGDEGSLQLSAIEAQRLKKAHYVLDAEQLQEVFPDLVYEDEDGKKLINYVEMIPLLVQSINELNAKLSVLEVSENFNNSRGTSTITSQSFSKGAYTQAILYQNSPNPFTSQTVIRFSLPDNAQNAYIYIFDMQGKMVKQLPVNASMQSVTINGYELQAGIYLYSLVAGGQEIDTKRMILSK